MTNTEASVSSGVITYDCSDGVARIGLNRPEKRNALSEQLQHSLGEAAARASAEAKVAIVYGVGENFSAGLDLAEVFSWVHDAAITEQKMRARRTQRPFEEIARSPIPFIAAITGACVGAGLEIASACHLRVADPTAFFALLEPQRGIFLGGGGSARISRILGVPLMTDMMLTGRVLSADKGERRGLVNYVVADGQALAHAQTLAVRITENSTAVNAAVVSWLPRIAEFSLDDGFFAEALVAESMMSGAGGSQERLGDFVAKRARPLDRPSAASEGT